MAERESFGAQAARPQLVPVTLRQANAFLERRHGHSPPARRYKFSVGAAAGGRLVGVATAGLPETARHDDGETIEVRQVCVREGAPRTTRALLYGACWRAARALGYRRGIAHVHRGETDRAFRTAGFQVIAVRGRGSRGAPFALPRHLPRALPRRIPSAGGEWGRSPHHSADRGPRALPTYPRYSEVGA